MQDAFRKHGFRSVRSAAQETGVDYVTLHRAMKGVVPGMASLVKWSNALGDDVNRWLRLGGFPTVENVESAPAEEEPPDASLTFTQPEVPELVRTMIEKAPTREDKIAVAFNYLASLPDVRFGADGVQTPDARLHIIRTYERLTNVRVLPPEVV